MSRSARRPQPSVPYDADWYARFSASSRASARVIAPLLREWTGARSVIDVGCGQGVWLAVWQEIGVEDVFGVDGPHVDARSLRIDARRFRAHDLARPLALERRFELATCFEVAEHLPRSAAQALVASLARLSPIVAFSAAIPHQGGTGHVNEQWPGWWAEHFAREGLHAVDVLRPRIWNDDRVSWWYAQNTLVFADDASLAAHPALARAHARTDVERLAVVHPAAWALRAGRAGPGAALRRAARPLRRWLGR